MEALRTVLRVSLPFAVAGVLNQAARNAAVTVGPVSHAVLRSASRRN